MGCAVDMCAYVSPNPGDGLNCYISRNSSLISDCFFKQNDQQNIVSRMGIGSSVGYCQQNGGRIISRIGVQSVEREQNHQQNGRMICRMGVESSVECEQNGSTIIRRMGVDSQQIWQQNAQQSGSRMISRSWKGRQLYGGVNQPTETQLYDVIRIT